MIFVHLPKSRADQANTSNNEKRKKQNVTVGRRFRTHTHVHTHRCNKEKEAKHLRGHGRSSREVVWRSWREDREGEMDEILFHQT